MQPKLPWDTAMRSNPLRRFGLLKSLTRISPPSPVGTTVLTYPSRLAFWAANSSSVITPWLLSSPSSLS